MRKLHLAWLFLLIFGVLAGCGKSQTEPPQTQNTANAAVFYSAGRKAVEASDNLMLDYTLQETRTVGDNTFTKHMTGKASYQGYAREGMAAKVEQTLDFGYYRCDYEQSYYEGRAYAEVNDCYFWSKQSAEEFASRQLPPALLTPALYDTITYGETAGTVLFSDPRGMEAWVGDGQLLEASGQAELDSEGKLLRTTYQVQYRNDEAEFSLFVTVGVMIPEQLDLSGLRDLQNRSGVWLSDLDAPRKLLQVVADVYSAQRVNCELAETISSEAIPLFYQRDTRVLLMGRDASLETEVVNTSKLSNNRGVITESSQSEWFKNGVYTVSLDGSDPVQNGSVTANAMRQYSEDTILSGLLAVKYLSGVSVEEDGKLLKLEFGGSDSFRKTMTQHLMTVLQVDLDALAESSQNISAGGYLTVDTQTGLPVVMGMFMEKSHTLDGVTYRLDYRLDESLTFSEE